MDRIKKKIIRYLYFKNETVGDCGILDVIHEKVNIIKVDLDNISFITSNIWNDSP